jgi:hypothetical protein
MTTLEPKGQTLDVNGLRVHYLDWGPVASSSRFRASGTRPPWLSPRWSGPSSAFWTRPSRAPEPAPIQAVIRYR